MIESHLRFIIRTYTVFFYSVVYHVKMSSVYVIIKSSWSYGVLVGLLALLSNDPEWHRLSLPQPTPSSCVDIVQGSTVPRGNSWGPDLLFSSLSSVNITILSLLWPYTLSRPPPNPKPSNFLPLPLSHSSLCDAHHCCRPASVSVPTLPACRPCLTVPTTGSPALFRNQKREEGTSVVSWLTQESMSFPLLS